MKRMNYTMDELVKKILDIFEENRCSTLGKKELEEQEIFFEGLKKNKNGMDQGDGYFFCKDGVLEADICYADGEFYLDLYDFRNGTWQMQQSDWDEMEREKEWKLVQIQKLQKEIDLMENMLETQKLRRLFPK